MMKKILSLALVFSLSVSAAEQAITQWVYNKKTSEPDPTR